MSLFSFNGGIHLPPHKELTRTSPHPALAVPHICHYMLFDSGASLAPTVNKGDFVAEGQIIARDQSDSVPPVHASIPGRILSADAIGGIRIEAQGSFPSLHPADSDIVWKSQHADAVRRSVFLAGISLPLPTGKDTVLIINTIDSEPNMRTRNEILRTQKDELAEGIDICAKALSASRVFIVTDRSSKNDAAALMKMLSSRTFIHTVSMKVISSKYPMSAAPLVIKRVFKVEVEPARSGLDEGFAVIGSETALAVSNAVVHNKPYCERIITITGKPVKKPGNYKIRFGTPVSHIMEELGITPDNIEGVVIGGEMTGKITTDYNTPIDKRVDAILFLSQKESLQKGKYPCIRCGKCADVCPMRLLPNDLAHSASSESSSLALRKICISCGCCSAVCPSGIPLARMISTTGESDG